MRARSIALAVVSLVIGFVLGTGFDWTVQARQLPQFDPSNPGGPRIQSISAGGIAGFGTNSAVFLKDTKSKACWLVVFWGADRSLAPAPPEACN